MNCKRAQRNIALWVGHDLDEASEHHLERHLACCPYCREYASQMTSCLRLLQSPDEEPTEWHASDLWPALSVKLSAAEKQFAAQRFNGWLPATVMATAVACLVFAIFWRSGSNPEQNARHWRPVAPTVTPVGFPADQEAFVPDSESRDQRSAARGALWWVPEEWERSGTSIRRPRNGQRNEF